MLKFIGKGSCFNVDDVNNSAYYKDNDKLLLIDCGESVFKAIVDTNLLDGIKQIDILITHFHPDHIGSLPTLLFYVEIVYKIKPTVIYPEKEKIELFLSLSGNHPNKFDIVKPDEFKRFEINAIEQVHSDYMNSYGYLIRLANKTIYYSGDSKKINDNILNMFINGEIDYFYQDVSRYDTFSHMYIDDLERIIPENKRSQINCMHFDDEETKRIVSEKKFSI